MNDEMVQYPDYEGYEPVGIGGRYYDSLWPEKVSVLYVNTKPVICAITEVKDNKEYYLTFGEPIEKEKVKELIISMNK